MDVRHLITFKKLAEFGSFTKTAENLGYTQSTITSHIQQLEAALEVKLLDRVGRKISLTGAGKELYENANELLKIYDKINEIKVCGETIRGHINISAPESMMESKIEPLLKKFIEEYPSVTISVMTGSCPRSYKALLDGEVDIAFLFLPVQADERLEVKKISEEPLVLISSIEGKHKNISTLIKDNIFTENIILNEKDCSYRLTLESKLLENNIACKSKLELWSIESIKRMVARNLGVSLLPLAAVHSELENGSLKTIDTGDFFKPVTLHLVHNRLRHCTKAMDTFMQTAMSNLQK